MIGLQTIRDGDRVAVWSKNGTVRVVDGPRRLWLFRRMVQPLNRYSAEANEYLAIRYRDGRAEHMRGPAEVWHDPVRHESVTVMPALPIDAHEALVIYDRDSDGAVDRHVLRGPAQYMPEPNEWLHEFTWHGSDPKHPRRKVPYALRFKKLRVIPDQTYFDIADVRTADDALIVVQVMIFFELVDIERMLDQTHDPIADFINAATSDVIDFAASRTFERFKRETEQLSEIATYPNLVERAGRIGYRINNVVYRGYEAGAELQAMHDHAIEARTSLQLEAETEAQAQQLADLKLARETDRDRMRRELERQQTEHKQAMRQLEHEEQLRQQRAEAEQQATGQRMIHEVELEHIEARHRQRTTFLRGLAEMQVDLTRYLVAQYQHPDRLIRIDGTGEQVHVHDDGDRR